MQEQDTIWLRPAVEIRACCQVPVVHLLILHYICQMEFPDGTSASVFKADDYNLADPEYRVRYWDKEGNYTDTNVQINGVNPRNASYLEMLAYTTYSDVEGFTKNAFGDFMNAARGVNGNISYDADNIKEKKDYMSMVKELMQLQYDSNNLPGYLSYKELYDYMNDKING